MYEIKDKEYDKTFDKMTETMDKYWEYIKLYATPDITKKIQSGDKDFLETESSKSRSVIMDLMWLDVDEEFFPSDNGKLYANAFIKYFSKNNRINTLKQPSNYGYHNNNCVIKSRVSPITISLWGDIGLRNNDEFTLIKECHLDFNMILDEFFKSHIDEPKKLTDNHLHNLKYIYNDVAKLAVYYTRKYKLKSSVFKTFKKRCPNYFKLFMKYIKLHTHKSIKGK